jgi:hypothetical protein
LFTLICFVSGLPITLYLIGPCGFIYKAGRKRVSRSSVLSSLYLRFSWVNTEQCVLSWDTVKSEWVGRGRVVRTVLYPGEAGCSRHEHDVSGENVAGSGRGKQGGKGRRSPRRRRIQCRFRKFVLSHTLPRLPFPSCVNVVYPSSSTTCPKRRRNPKSTTYARETWSSNDEFLK